MRYGSGGHDADYVQALFHGAVAQEDRQIASSEPDGLHLEADPHLHPVLLDGSAHPSELVAALFYSHRLPLPAGVLHPRDSLDLAEPVYAHGSLRALSPLHAVQDVLASWHQHLQMLSEQVIWLPIEICAWLLAYQPAYWDNVSVIPDGVTTTIDSGTGLDAMNVASTATWGVNAQGQAYFTPDGDMGSDESAQMIVVQGQPILIR